MLCCVVIVLFVFVLYFVYPLLQVFLDSPFLIVTSVLFNVDRLFNTLVPRRKGCLKIMNTNFNLDSNVMYPMYTWEPLVYYYQGVENL